MNAWHVLSIMAALGCASTASHSTGEREFFCRGAHTVSFAPNSARLAIADESALLRLATCLQADRQLRMRITGSADAAGRQKTNRDLAARRVQTVAEYLETRGVLRRQLRLVDFGPDSAVCNDWDEGCMAKNRRARLDVERVLAPM